MGRWLLGQGIRITMPQHNARKSIVQDFLHLTSVPGAVPDIISALREEAYPGDGAIRRADATGPMIGRDLQRHAVHATCAALGGMLLWFAFRLGWMVVAVFRDVVTARFFSPLDREIELTVLVVLLALVGCSTNAWMNRVREKRRPMQWQRRERLLEGGLNPTQSRVVLISGLMFSAVLSLLVFDGEVLRGFWFALVAGVLVMHSRTSTPGARRFRWRNAVPARSVRQRAW